LVAQHPVLFHGETVARWQGQHKAVTVKSLHAGIVGQGPEWHVKAGFEKMFK
jgi:hypothetical protein